MAYETRIVEQGPLRPGTRVEVRTRFSGRWANAFEIAGVTEAGYHVRRLSDGAELPASFSPTEVRPAGER